MDPTRFDRISQLFADRRLSRRAAMTATAGAAATMAAIPLVSSAQQASPEASPIASPAAGEGGQSTFLFVQAFQSGTLTANSNDDLHTLTLEHGLGQTIFFGDRPSREVGLTPTKDFIAGFGFSPDNPPNAALIVEKGDDTDLAVLELTAPTYDSETRTATYQVRGLEAWDGGPTFGLEQSPLADISPAFEGAQLLIDDCGGTDIACVDNNTSDTTFTGQALDFCYAWGQCMPCIPYYHSQPSNCATWDYYKSQCNGGEYSSSCPSGDCHPYWGNGISDLLGCT